MGLLGWGIDPP